MSRVAEVFKITHDEEEKRCYGLQQHFFVNKVILLFMDFK